MSEELDRGDAHMYICRAGARWRIEQIFGEIYFNVYRRTQRLSGAWDFEELTIICPPHKQHELACSHGAPNGGPMAGARTSSEPQP